MLDSQEPSATDETVTSLRSKVARILDDVTTPVGQCINVAIALMTTLSAVIFIAETYPIPASICHNLTLINNVILCLFGIEYGLRLWCAEDKWRYSTSFYAIIDLIAILPSFLGLFNLSYLLILRWFRILKLIRFISNEAASGYLSSEDTVILTRILFTLFAIVFIYSGMIYQAEHTINPHLHTFLDASYFAIATMTTVGFGDITPVSEGGRLLTILMIWNGIVLIPWQIGDLVKRLVKSATKVETLCHACGTSFHDEDAQFCRVCGAKLTSG
ncbi:MAG: ion transporter [Leptolyngbyaceae bacterium]|nr:ion transporter [Leptolyngbyaceae bacterium]